MLVVRYYKLDSNFKYIPDYICCNLIEACADGNVRLLACSFNEGDPRATIIIKASQLISIRVKDGE